MAAFCVSVTLGLGPPLRSRARRRESPCWLKALSHRHTVVLCTPSSRTTSGTLAPREDRSTMSSRVRTSLGRSFLSKAARSASRSSGSSRLAKSNGHRLLRPGQPYLEFPQLRTLDMRCFRRFQLVRAVAIRERTSGRPFQVRRSQAAGTCVTANNRGLPGDTRCRAPDKRRMSPSRADRRLTRFSQRPGLSIPHENSARARVYLPP